MGELANGVERRRAVRVPVRGGVVMHADDGPLHATLENLSQSGALFSVAREPRTVEVELEMRLADGHGWINARTVRAEPAHERWRIAVTFDRVGPAMREAIDASIEAARFAAQRRPILVIDDHVDRRSSLIDRLATRGMTPLAPKTPLDAIDLLTRAHLHVSVCLLAPGFGVNACELASALSDSFPWITTADISDDLDATVARALDAWATTPVARLGTAIG
jgi:hypothetical protein